MDRSLWETRVRRGREFDATAHQFGANSGIAAMLDARYFVPFIGQLALRARLALYFIDAGQSETRSSRRPTSRRQQELYSELLGDRRPGRSRRRRWRRSSRAPPTSSWSGA